MRCGSSRGCCAAPGNLPGAPAIRWRDRRRWTKKRARAVQYSRGQDKKRRLYRELIAVAQANRAELQAVVAGLFEERRDGGRALACRGRPLSVADRAPHRPDATLDVR